MEINFIYMTAADKAEARMIAGELVAAGLAACVNILEGMNSIYMWQGEIQEDSEVVLIAKTTRACVPQLVEKVNSLHSYDCPCIVSLPVSDGHRPFLDWVVAEVKPE
jgi:periplasmic divalent cation tolerance protein